MQLDLETYEKELAEARQARDQALFEAGRVNGIVQALELTVARLKAELPPPPAAAEAKAEQRPTATILDFPTAGA